MERFDAEHNDTVNGVGGGRFEFGFEDDFDVEWEDASWSGRLEEGRDEDEDEDLGRRQSAILDGSRREKATSGCG